MEKPAIPNATFSFQINKIKMMKKIFGVKTSGNFLNIKNISGESSLIQILSKLSMLFQDEILDTLNRITENEFLKIIKRKKSILYSRFLKAKNILLENLIEFLTEEKNLIIRKLLLKQLELDKKKLVISIINLENRINSLKKEMLRLSIN
ncbi:MAG: hypothetical protein IR526_03775 [Bordetella sp.]|nr:MAG: hypothetical protein IR526_03775 [Bordetella sp.]